MSSVPGQQSDAQSPFDRLESAGFALVPSADVPPTLVCVEVRGLRVAVPEKVLDWDDFARDAYLVERSVFAGEGLRLRSVYDQVASYPEPAVTDSSGRVVEDVQEVVSSSLAAAIAMSSRAASELVSATVDLFELLPRTADMLRYGWIGQDTVTSIARHTMLVDRDLMPELDRKLVESLGPTRRRLHPPRQGPLKRLLSKLVERVDPVATRARAEQAREYIDCRISPGQDDLSELVATLPADWAVEIDRRIRDLVNRSGPRPAGTLGKSRAQALLALTRGWSTLDGDGDGDGDPAEAAPPRRVVLHAYFDGREGEAGDALWLAGHGPVSTFTFDRLAPSMQVKRSSMIDLADPEAPSALRYAPGAELRMFCQGRDGTCVFPGCTIPAERCQLDHIEPFEHADPSRGGRTTSDNLASLCANHHQRKTLGTWQYSRELDGGYTWVHGPLHPRRTVGAQWHSAPVGPLAHLAAPVHKDASARQSSSAVTGGDNGARLRTSLRAQRKRTMREYYRRCVQRTVSPFPAEPPF